MANNLQRRDKLTDVQALREWYMSEDVFELTQHQEVKRSRLLLVQSLMTKGRANQDIVKKLKKDYSLSEAQAYRDIRDAVSLYGDMRKAEKEGLRWIMYELGLWVLRRAKKDNDLKQYNAAMSNLIKITGVDKEDAELPDFEKIQPSLVLAVLPEGLHEWVQNKLNDGPLDLNEITNEIVEHEDLSDTEQADPISNRQPS